VLGEILLKIQGDSSGTSLRNFRRKKGTSDFCSTPLGIFRKFVLPLVLIGCGFLSSSASAQSVQPNIVIILADDMGYGDVAFNGCPDYATPNIDSLTVNGVGCSNGYVTHPFCSPSRAALVTGRYQHRFGHENQPEDYVCGAIGKWHLGSAPNLRPLQRGFDDSWVPRLLLPITTMPWSYETIRFSLNPSICQTPSRVKACPVLTDITCVPTKVGRKIRAVFSQILVSISFQP
jgi:Sulfatase